MTIIPWVGISSTFIGRAWVAYYGWGWSHKITHKITYEMASPRVSLSAGEEATCLVCSNHLREPKLLPCFHTFCRPCLKELSETSADEVTVVCPSCRDQHSVPAQEGLDAFSDNVALRGLLESLRLHGNSSTSSGEGESDRGVVVCGNGVDENPATGYCFDCKVHLCGSCWDLHKKMVASKEHRTSSLEEIKLGSAVVPEKAPECREHKGERVKLYCSDCSDVICRDCAITSHRKHDFEYLTEVRARATERLSELLQTLNQKDMEMDKHLSGVKKMLRTNAEQSKACQQNIDSTCDALIELIEKYRAKSHKQLQQNLDVAQTQCRSTINATELTKTKLTAAASFINRLQSCTDHEIVQVSKDEKLLERAETLTDFSIKEFAGTPVLVHNKAVSLDFQCFERDLPKIGALEPRDIHVYKPGSATPEVSLSLSGNITGGVVPLHMVQVTIEVDSESIPCDVMDDYVRNYWKAKFEPLKGDHEYKVDVVVAGVEAPTYTFTFNPANKRRASMPPQSQ